MSNIQNLQFSSRIQLIRLLMLLGCFTGFVHATRIPLNLDIPEGWPVKKLGIYIKTTEDAVMSGEEHLASSVRLIVNNSVHEISRTPGESVPLTLTLQSRSLNTATAKFKAQQSETTANNFDAVRLLDAQGNPVSAEGDAVFVELDQRRELAVYRFRIGPSPGRVTGAFMQLTDREGKTMTAEELGLEFIPDAQGNLRQLKTPLQLLDVNQVRPDLLEFTVHDLRNVLPEKIQGLYTARNPDFSQMKHRILKIPSEEGTFRLEHQSFEKNRLIETSYWYYNAGEENYDFKQYESGSNQPVRATLFKGSNRTGHRIEETVRPYNRGTRRHRQEYVLSPRRNRMEKILDEIEVGGKLTRKQYAYYQEGPLNGKKKTEIREDGSWTFWDYATNPHEIILEVTPVETKKRVKVEEPAVDDEELAALLEGFSTAEQFEEISVWTPETPPENAEEAIKVGKAVEYRYDILNNPTGGGRFKSEERSHYLEGVLQYREWEYTSTSDNGLQIHYHETGSGPEAVYGEDGNTWTRRETYEKGEIPNGYGKSEDKMITRNDGWTQMYYYDEGSWNENTKVFTVAENGPQYRKETTDGTVEKGQWMPGTTSATEIFPKKSRRPLHQSLRVLQADGTWETRPDKEI